MSDFSVIICAYTEARWDDLVAAITSSQQQTLPAYEIIVVIDHNSRLIERVRQNITGVVVIENTGRKGLSDARNSGLAVAKGQFVAFLDDDAIAAPDWLERMAQKYSDPVVLGVGGAIEPLWMAGRPAWFPAEFNWVVGCTYRGMPETDAPVRNLIGCNMSFRREIFRSVKGFRIGRVGVLSLGQENDETELCIRVGKQWPKSKLLYLPDAVVKHKVYPGRTTFAYFARRCYSEGISKGYLSKLVGQDRGLATEKSYVIKTLPMGVLSNIIKGFFGLKTGYLLQAATIVAGLAITIFGYLRGAISWRTSQKTGEFDINKSDVETLQELPIDNIERKLVS